MYIISLQVMGSYLNEKSTYRKEIYQANSKELKENKDNS